MCDLYGCCMKFDYYGWYMNFACLCLIEKKLDYL